MPLTGWDEIDRMFATMDLLRKGRLARLFSDFDRFPRLGGDWFVEGNTPRTNLYDSGDKFEIRAEVPGLTQADLNVKIQGNYLEISGTRKADKPEGYSAHRTERGAIAFSRSFTLPAEVDADKVEATLKNGVLTLSMPKAEAAKPKQISIS